MPRKKKDEPQTIESLTKAVAALTKRVAKQERYFGLLQHVIEDLDEADAQAVTAFKSMAEKVRELIESNNNGQELIEVLAEWAQEVKERLEIAEGRITTTQVVFGSVLRGAGYGKVIDGVEKGLRERAARTPDQTPDDATVIPMTRPIQA